MCRQMFIVAFIYNTRNWKKNPNVQQMVNMQVNPDTPMQWNTAQ